MFLNGNFTGNLAGIGSWGSKPNTPLGTPKGSNTPASGSPQHQSNLSYGWGTQNNTTRMGYPSG